MFLPYTSHTGRLRDLGLHAHRCHAPETQSVKYKLKLSNAGQRFDFVLLCIESFVQACSNLTLSSTNLIIIFTEVEVVPKMHRCTKKPSVNTHANIRFFALSDYALIHRVFVRFLCFETTCGVMGVTVNVVKKRPGRDSSPRPLPYEENILK